MDTDLVIVCDFPGKVYYFEQDIKGILTAFLVKAKIVSKTR